MVDKEPDYVFKIAVVGDYAVGKTSLISRFIQRKFLKEYKPTLGVNLILKELEITQDDKPILCNLVLWDIAGQERYASVRKLYYKGCSAAMLVYDVTRMDTFNSLETTWVKDYMENTNGERIFVIVGNKADLEDIRKVSTQDGEDLKDRIGAVQFLETSAKDGTNVDDAFLNLVHLLLEKSNQKK